MSKRILFPVVLVIVLASLAFLFVRKPQAAKTDGKISVVATIFPWADLAAKVGGDQVSVKNLTTGGVEPHDYEPTPQDSIALQSAQLVIQNGSSVDAWADKPLASRPASVTLLHLSDTVQLHSSPEEGEPSGATDPHIWLDPVIAKNAVAQIRDALITIDSDHADAYRTNATTVLANLDTLDKEFRAGLAQCSRHDIVTSHAAFGYLAQEYGLTQVPIAGLSPEEEPSAQRLAEITDFAKKNGVTTIFFESLVSPKLSETIASAVGAKTAVLDPMESLTADRLANHEDYFSVLRSNLTAIRDALGCTAS